MAHMRWPRLPGRAMDYEAVEFIVAHCSATRPSQKVTAQDIHRMHLARGFSCGYHQIIQRDGTLDLGRPLNRSGAHVKSMNFKSVGICLVGGVDRYGKSVMNFTKAQLRTFDTVLAYDRLVFPDATVLGHRDMSPDLNGDGVIRRNEWMKDCPCLDIEHYLRTGEARFA